MVNKLMRLISMALVSVTLSACASFEQARGLGEQDSGYGAFLVARYAGAQRDLSTSAEYYDRALDHAPESLFLAQRAFLSALIAGNFDLADRHVQQAVGSESVSDLAQAYILTAQLVGKDLDVEGERLPSTDLFASIVVDILDDWNRMDAGGGRQVAADLMERQSRTGYGNTGAHMALMLEAVGAFDDAERAYRAVRLSSGRAPLQTLMFGEFLERRGRHASAIAIYRDQMERTNRRDPDILAALERSERQARPPNFPNERQAAARAIYLAAAPLRSQVPGNYSALFLRLVERLDPGLDRNLLSLGDILRDLEMSDLAVEAYDQIDRGPLASDAEVRSAWLSHQSGNFALDSEELAELGQKRSTSTTMKILIGDIQRLNGDCDQAINTYENLKSDFAEQDLPLIWQVIFFSGLCHEHLGRWNEAEASYLSALEVNPNASIALNHLGYSWIVRGERVEEGFDMVRRAVQIEPGNGNMMDSLGWGYFKQGNLEQSLLWLEQAAAKEPSNPTINWHLGDAYAANGRELEAQFQWRRALQLDPEPEEIELIHRRLEMGLDAGPVDAQ
jgi:tetratricopeptide (TPR) repeat protein